MIELFSDLPEALLNSVKIAEKCNLDLELGKFYLPDFEVPKGQTREDHLRTISKDGLKKRINNIKGSVNSYEVNNDLYFKRLDYELDMICNIITPAYNSLITSDRPLS